MSSIGSVYCNTCAVVGIGAAAWVRATGAASRATEFAGMKSGRNVNSVTENVQFSGQNEFLTY
jgi:hypothetical protein